MSDVLNPKLLKGFRDFSPEETNHRNYIFDTLKQSFKIFGFQEINTPAIENLSTLNGNYGEEGDKLIFKILKSGNYLDKIPENIYKSQNSKKLLPHISDKALKYDLTIPFARYVSANFNEINFPFKRFQIQPVWRADRPQKSRYREFYQCDCDIIGSDSILNELDLIYLINHVFKKLFKNKIDYTIEFSNIKVLQSIHSIISSKKLNFFEFSAIIDKLDKIGLQKVIELLKQKEITEASLNKIEELFSKSLVLNKENLEFLSSFFNKHNISNQGIKEIEELLKFSKTTNIENLKFNPKLSRGLNYYSNTIIEVKVKNYPSICGGGRYDNLTALFGKHNISGVGISFGADRIYDIMIENNLFPYSKNKVVKVFFLNFGEKEFLFSMEIINQLRKNNISTSIYPEFEEKLKKQIKYASKINSEYVAMVGSEELKNNSITLKNMNSGKQQNLSKENFIKFFLNN